MARPRRRRSLRMLRCRKSRARGGHFHRVGDQRAFPGQRRPGVRGGLDMGAGAGHGGGQLTAFPQPGRRAASVTPLLGRLLDDPPGPQARGGGGDGRSEGWPGRQERLVRDRQDGGFAVGVGGQQPSRDEGVQLGTHQFGQLVSADAPPDRAAVLIDGDQSQQPGDHLVTGAPGSGHGVGQGRVGLAGQCPPDAPELVIARSGKLAAAAHAVGELGEGERQQRQRLPAAGVGDEGGHQFGVHPDPGQPGWPLDDRRQGLPAQRPQREGPRRQIGQLRAGQ